MASIRERNGKWTVSIRRRGHDPVYKTFGTRKDAERWAQRAESKIEDGDVISTCSRWISRCAGTGSPQGRPRRRCANVDALGRGAAPG